MSGKIGSDAFEFYVSLGDDRSYAAVAERYEVTKRAVVKAAARENWTVRMKKMEEAARVRADAKMTVTMEEIRTRHQKLLRAMSARAAKALSEFPLTSGMEAMRAAEIVIKLERLVFGEATQRTAVSVEQITRREIESLLVVEEATATKEPQRDADDW